MRTRYGVLVPCLVVLLLASAGAAEKPTSRSRAGGEDPSAAPVQGVQIPLPDATGRVPGVRGTQPTTIVLKDGKPENAPTCYAGSVRIRVLTGDHRFPASADQLVVPVEARAEPRMHLQRITAVKVTKAVDDLDQRLEQAIVAADPNVPPGGVIMGPAGIAFVNPAQAMSSTQVVPVHLKKATKDSRTLKELSGTLTVPALLTAEPLITVDNIQHASGKTFKGKYGSVLRVISLSMMDDGQLILRLQIDSPTGDGPLVPQIQFQKVPAIPQVPIPLPQPVPLPNGGIFLIQPQPVPKIQIQIIAPGGVVAPNVGRAGVDLKLLDEKGQVIPQTQSRTERQRIVRAGQPKYTYALGYRPQKDQVPAKLVYTGSCNVTLDIPFWVFRF
jgi:hypothetical protein